MQLTTQIGSIERYQPRFECDEGNRVLRAHGNAENSAAVRVETAGCIQREYRDAAGVERGYEFGISASDLALEADTKQSVDDQAEAAQLKTGNVRQCFASG